MQILKYLRRQEEADLNVKLIVRLRFYCKLIIQYRKKDILRPNNGLILKLMPLLSAIYLGPTPKRRSQAGSLQHFLDDGHTQIHHGKIIEPSAKSLDGGPYT